MKRLINILCIAIPALIILFFFKTCTGFVSSIDGDAHSKMQHLTGDYYYNPIDGGIWFKDTTVDAFRGIITTRVDSLSWNTTTLIGYSQYKYLQIQLSSGQISHPYEIPATEEKYDSLENVPPIRILSARSLSH